MSRILSLLTLLTLVACVGGGESPSDSVGGTRRLEPISVSVGDTQRIRMVCNALSNKEDQMSVLATSSYTFSYAEKGCSDTNMGNSKDVVTRIQRSGSEYYFKKTDGELFAFSDVETSTKGIMAEICASVDYLVSPMQTSSTGAMWFTANANSEECQTDASHVCMLIEKGSVVNGADYRIHTTEWIRFSVGAERRGFFTTRKVTSSAGCKDGKKLERKAILK